MSLVFLLAAATSTTWPDVAIAGLSLAFLALVIYIVTR